MINSNYAEARVIGFKRLRAFLASAIVILPVFVLYRAGHY